MSDETANGVSSGSNNESAGKSNSGKKLLDAAGPSVAAAAIPAVTQGLQSVMAVIGDNYDPAVSGAVDKASSAKIDAAQASKLTDKIDAARDRQGEGSTVKKGLQSIMAVIGEEYEEPAASSGSDSVISTAPANALPTVKKNH